MKEAETNPGIFSKGQWVLIVILIGVAIYFYPRDQAMEHRDQGAERYNTISEPAPGTSTGVDSKKEDERISQPQRETQRVDKVEGYDVRKNEAPRQKKKSESKPRNVAPESAKEPERNAEQDERRQKAAKLKEEIDGLRTAAEGGDKDAQSNFGILYLNGKKVSKNMSEAAKWLRMSADQGHSLAQTELGFLYMDGTGIEKDLVEAARLFELAANQGVPRAQNALGVCYERQLGVPRSDEKALYWYKLSAENGYASAMYNLAQLYYSGIPNMSSDDERLESNRWLLLAAEKGNVDAQNLLGDNYRRGNWGLQEDYREATKWYSLAAKQGHKNAIYWLKRLKGQD